ncbi:argonaut-like protein [Dictyostelium discoideum AX4]|uniref:Argonaut-like protein n=1 Tax=Dictyostelium discoideum TaxID=44689 RepID=Q54T78_DICDI|nr:argonaut-like protein [Dictyostelium discoideum AX4]EAL66401.1 argonaut-like protein [Dictyostelium discoideum AX4]|eukprot:XP_640373.1 argonaut-like protein [Dictyostelium discoideum AX4]
MTYLCDKKREVEGDIDEEKGSTKRFKSQGNIEYGNQKQFEPIITHSSQLAPSYQYPPHQYQYYPHQYPPYQQQYPLHYQYYNQNQQHFFDSSSQNQQYLPQFHQYHQPYLIPLLKKELIGSIVITLYNNKTYRINSIEWNKTPETKFTPNIGSDMSFENLWTKSY